MIEPEEPLGESDVFLEFQSRLSRAAPIDRPILLVGERGTGKELAARRLHFLSSRWDGPLAALNCAALSPGVLESELFGHEQGAFTGAARRREGRFEAADGGTFFLDELGQAPLEVQRKILRVVEYGVFERVGGSEPVNVDVRLVAATNADLPALARVGKFLPDLLDRLTFEVLVLPPLRVRRGDVRLLADHFAARMANELDRSVPEFSVVARRALESHDWPGNIRELKNVVERAVYRLEAEESVVENVDFDPFDTPWTSRLAAPAPEMRLPDSSTKSSPESAAADVDFDRSLTEALEQVEVRHVAEALRRTQGHQGRASELLGIGYHQLRRLLKKHAGRL
ncbi:phage shock protein operon transcriptional activator [Cerasicoccus arenae]|uniref:Phage shock protein operon transcriptional activator n=1 Tax=Cerasicoccus arenae TaxID=424488 RepID=A0A8J3GDG1_9BACT|nr:phage shock protein operon transcriptional activator [Cerasicoccus arenae]MBK1859625.1 phage shock protein operon transcriptional activator [Cerasicoccus arenae]GHB96337.1 phage shock protein operon transcriptional activator [Cerasicoccus arenae]